MARRRLGRVGPPSSVEGKLEVVNVACEVRRKHQFDRYEQSWPIWGRLGWYTFLCGDVPVAEISAQKPELAANNRAGR